MIGWLLAVAFASPSSGIPALDPGTEHGVVTGAVSSDTFLGIEARSTHTVAPRVSVGGGVDLPVMLWVQGGGLDTLRFVGQVTAEPLRKDRVGLVLHGQTRLGIQHDTLGTRIPWDLGLRAVPVVHPGRSTLGLALGWHQGLATYVHSGPVVQDTFPTGAPKNGWLSLPAFRWSLGGLASLWLSERVTLQLEGDWIGTVRSIDVGPMDLMMVGSWPFHASVGVGWRW